MSIINQEAFKKAKAITRAALGSNIRTEIIDMLEKSGEADVTSIYVRMKLEQSVASQHLAILRRENLVTTRRDGKQVFYSVNKEEIEKINAIFEQL